MISFFFFYQFQERIANLVIESTSKNDLTEVLRKLEEEQNELREEMKLHAGDVGDMEGRVQKLEDQKNDLEKEVEVQMRTNQFTIAISSFCYLCCPSPLKWAA